ncbi:UvrD-helicase domain-containing protein [Prevotella sp.]|uniref:UvrD-helicase domain-containing protein n=1 Tax=Prevotella sp. TaxID=59823 RepID=UPI002E76BFD3|nr:UvrD-helicase domain-containing protein [Prevotella sp.]MEE0669225.1 UvrD-helicase domain-containing protein [Prevotella sp.]
MTNSYALTIYKASAGSGKTFTLSVEYIKLLIKDPQSYRSTLAVTFTNKATEEMKLRILSQLYGIWKLLPDSKSYIDKIKEDLDVTEEYMSERAGIALHNIVHNYSYFRIETIDSFFQSVLRNLARELDLTANLRIELNDYQIERNAVDELINSLDENSELLTWIMEYIRENMDDDKDWNVIGNIKRFGENIFREYYKTNSKKLNERLLEEGFFKQYTTKLRQMRNEAEVEMQNEAAQFFDALNHNGIEINDLNNGKNGPAGYFIKIKKGIYNNTIVTKRLQKVLDDGSESSWVKQKSSKETQGIVRELANSTLTPLVHHAEDVRQKNWYIYGSAVLTLRHLNQLRLLNSIENKVRMMNVEQNRFLLSDTHTLLHSLIRDTDSPFIFEKIGNYLENIMIDEFQDTSTVQWQNFKVLLEECMSHGEQQGNLIVGDVKQSIYRWRSGDWRMLNNIEREFPYLNSMLNVCSLDTNYRSSRRVITFNNAFFKRASELEYADQKSSTPDTSSPEQLKKAYSDVAQKVPSFRDNHGYVSINLLPNEDYRQQALQKTAEAVSLLLDSGANYSDIAILVRSNDIIQLIAEFFANELPDVKIVSDEAFRLDSSVSVNIIVNAMLWLTHPDNILAKAYIAKAYQTYVLKKSEQETNKLLATAEGIDSALPCALIDKRNDLLTMPIFELAEQIYTLFNIGNIKGEDAYLYAFYDALTDFIANNTADIDSFVEEWNDSIAAKTIQASAIDGIRIITIHQSKGLEFEHVVIPFCDWTLEKGNTIWCTPQVEPYNELPLIPVDFSASQMKGTIYEFDYNEEHLQNCVDNLNLLYVAFTRAASSLFVIAKRGTPSSRSYIVEQAITDIKLEGSSLDGDPSDKKAELLFSYGELEIVETKTKKKSDNIFTPEVENMNVDMATFSNKVEFKQSNKSRDFVADDDENTDDDDRKQLSYIKTGKILHYLFSTINTTDDIDTSLAQLEMDGLIEESDTNIKRLRDMLHKRFSNRQVADWFSSRWTLFNECTILDYDAATDTVREHRPDRVMKDEKTGEVVIVDFKFGSPRPEYVEQVNRYKALTQNMGYPNVKGYLWFVYSNRIEEV